MNSNNSNKRKGNPRQNCSFLSSASFFYTIPTFLYGRRKGFDEDNMYETVDGFRSKLLGDKLEKLWCNELKNALRTKRAPSLRKVLCRAFGLQMLTFAALLLVIECAIKPAQAVMVGRLVSFYTLDNVNTGVLPYAFGIIFLTFLNTALFHPYIANSQMVGLKAKISCGSLIYRKALKLHYTALCKTSVGQIVNLLSNDAVILIRFSVIVNYVLIAPVQCLVVTYLMYQEVGFSAIVGVLVIVLCTPFYYFLSKGASKYRLKTAMRTDERVRFMAEVISGMQVIKMYAWEKPMENILNSLRKFEMKYITLSSYTKAVYLTLDVLLIPTSLYVTILVYVIHHQLTADNVFSLTVFYTTFHFTMAWSLPQGLCVLGETLISIDRITKFLTSAEIILNDAEKMVANSGAIEITHGTAKWNTKITLENITFAANPGSLIAVIGQVGCGKSSLINALLKELPLTSGRISVNGSVSYAPQDPWLFGGSVRDNILFGQKVDLLRYKEVIRVCALECDLQLLPFGDNTIVGGRGSSLSGGQKARISLARAVYRQADIYLLDDPLSAVDLRVGEQIFENCIKGFLKGKTVILVTHQRQYLKDRDRVIALESGTILSEINWKEANVFAREQISEVVSPALQFQALDGKTKDAQNKEQISRGSVSKNVYLSYFTLGGGIGFTTLTLFLLLLCQVSVSSSSYFLAYWVNAVDLGNETAAGQNLEASSASNQNIYIYSTITLFCIVIASVRAYVFYTLCLKSSNRMHGNMLSSVLRATMRFLNTNSHGRIINRFSQDLETVDTQLPTVCLNALQAFIGFLACIVIIAMVNYWFLLSSFIIGIMLYLLRAFCLVTIRNVKRLEGITRSPVFEHLGSSLQGLATIRAFKGEKILQKEFDQHQDLHSCCHHLFLSTTEAMGALLGYVSGIYVAIVTLTCTLIGNGMLGGNVGLAVTQCLQVATYMQRTIRQSAELENQMTSVERILEYDKIEHEDSLGREAPTLWPSKGEIAFHNVNLAYYLQGPLALRNISFRIMPNEKVGVVGRTGAGKSSIIAALFRLSYLTGKILVDDVDINNLNLREFRSKISIIPQSPVVFSGTLRTNLDPFEEFEDCDLWSALDKVELKEFFSALPLGLDFGISQGGSNVSVGQRQLICLARIILRKNKILVMDEATASIDLETDKLVQRTIRKVFEDCTIITITHRLDSIMDCDRIMVISAGEVVEFDRPSILLKNNEGHFYKMTQQL
ncbi:hypothetical protein PPYR_08839 [Photinus pyralis]|uniref:Multidrug resistance-associated protein lethal(2)03659 n=1 Tax=Photinus pyralis TaxID=7054 RepID=A0A5N4AKL8_PHOPY|nr:probable multidrug resistance-associated protein lethal(2)03659 [Photinus pyralis]XP_031345995.1 probable multidrug resistance-associated protein lethal(2)03659 [Photinus pyralis]XP_031345996.1 probable multidrug resistance-associated protein lethal(2)03659 [Photinus pyralis]XP_031345997.1 probable multidrug resistance-associated protein lethal(2)03659 [Photinus pyralis]XP_031345998.1 probable multidrug resistance-associated protein lethal(2)03659 [Photinus pyralis]XP_031345999.1 probable m